MTAVAYIAGIFGFSLLVSVVAIRWDSEADERLTEQEQALLESVKRRGREW